MGVVWHPSTESPKKKRIVGAFIEKGRREDMMTFEVISFSSDVIPCEVHHVDDKTKLCVAWTDYKEFIKGITPEMIAEAKAGAWVWWD